MRDRIESSAIHNSVNRSGVVDSGKIFIVNIERGEREGPKHSLMNTPHIDYHTHRSGANKSKVQAQHEVLPGSANAGIALQGYATPRDIRPAKVLRPRGSDLQSRLGTRHYKGSCLAHRKLSFREKHQVPSVQTYLTYYNQLIGYCVENNYYNGY